MGFWVEQGAVEVCGPTPTGATDPTSGAPVTVVGCGNWRDRDDRIGPRVLGALRRRLDAGVELADVGITVLGLLDLLHGQDLLLLVDACVGRARPGEVLVVAPDLDRLPLGRPSLHQIGPLETLAVARELYPERLPREIRLVLVETGGLDERAEAAALARAVATVQREIASWRDGLPAGAAPNAPATGDLTWNSPRS